MKSNLTSHRLQGFSKLPSAAGCAIHRTEKYLGLVLGLTLFTILSLTAPVQKGWAHGGKTHVRFTALQALQKTTGLYNQLLTSGKLDESWETSLVQVRIKPPNPSGNSEFIIEFSKEEGDPKTVYFFLTNDGKYAGSNHTGP